MIKRNQKILNLLNGVSDGILLFIAYFAAVFVRIAVLGGSDNAGLFTAPYLIMAALFSVAMVLVYVVLRMYGSYRFKDPGSEFLTIFAANGVGVLALLAILFLFRGIDFPRLAMVLYWLFGSLLVVIKRWIGRSVLQHYRRLGYNQKHVIVAGSGNLAKHYAADIQRNPHMGFEIDGYLSRAEADLPGTWFGDFSKAEEILDQRNPDELVIALQPEEADLLPQVIAAADKEGVHLSIVPFYNDYIPPHPTIDVMGDTKLINLRATPLDNLGWAALKRTMDVCGALVLIVLSSPIMLITAIGVKVTSPGPILFRQERVGKDKKPFMMLKFRSMRVTGTETTGWSRDVDPRKTKFGSFIRKCSIDELPQFFNVLKGDMSLIGPRPEVPFHVSHFKEEIPLYLVRQQVRPGITGWAQVHGLRGDTSIEERVKYDIWYIENWSLGLDIRILFKTAFGGMINSEVI